jgi:hypothetical protein
MTPNEMITDVRQDANMPSAQGRAGDSEILRRLNRAKDVMALKIIESDVKFWEVDEKISFTADTEEYDLPRNLWKGKVTMVERLDSAGKVLRRLDPIRFQEKERYTSTQAPLTGAGTVYWLRGLKIGFAPKPSQALTDAVKVYGIQFPHDMFWGVLPTGSDITTTTFKMPASGTDLKAGRLHTEKDYYKNARIRVITGSAGKGVERKITAFNAATQVATIDTAWTVADVQAQEFVVLCDIPEEYHHALVAGAVRTLVSKQKDRTAFELATQTWREAFDQLTRTIEPRNFDFNERVVPPVDDETGW